MGNTVNTKPSKSMEWPIFNFLYFGVDKENLKDLSAKKFKRSSRQPYRPEPEEIGNTIITKSKNPKTFNRYSEETKISYRKPLTERGNQRTFNKVTTQWNKKYKRDNAREI